MAVETKWTRTHHTLRDEKTGQREVFPSVNQAKKQSRQRQMKEDRALGRGSVRIA